MTSGSRRKLFTSESVTMGHPDKMADQISDGILDAFLTGDPYSRVAVETLLTTGLVVVAGEVTSKTRLTVQDLIDAIRKAAARTTPNALTRMFQPSRGDTVTAPKMEHYADKATRVIPLFGELRPYLEEAFELARLPDDTRNSNPLADVELLRVADRLLTELRPALLLITLGELGMLLCQHGQKPG